MKWTKELIPNIFIEIQGSSNGSAPDKQGGMSTNSCTLWQRLQGNIKTNWVQCSYTSIMRTKIFWELVESEKDIEEAWKATTYEILENEII